jgi:hypothetical protein
MVFLNLRSGSKAGLRFHGKHASRRAPPLSETTDNDRSVSLA